VANESSIHNVRVRTPSHLVVFPWESAKAFQERALAAYPPGIAELRDVLRADASA
jgi:hypothetical protein